MAVGRFTRRAALRAGLSAGVAAPFGRQAAAAAATAGAAQEQPLVGAALAAAAAGGLAAARRRRSRSRSRQNDHANGTLAALAIALRVGIGVGIGVATRVVWSVAPKEPAAVAPHRTWAGLEPAPTGEGIGIVVNTGAGASTAGNRNRKRQRTHDREHHHSPDHHSPDRDRRNRRSRRPNRNRSRNRGQDPAALLAEALPDARIVTLDDPACLPTELERLAAAGVRALGVAGGDGSINTAAGVALDRRLPLVVVPAGTLNHLARDLGVESVHDAVEAVRSGHAVEIDVARIAGRPFLNTASFGSYVEVVDAREELEGRIGKWPALVVAVARVLRSGRAVEVDLDGRAQRLWVAFVGNCRYQPEGMAPTWRERLDDGQLDVRMADASHPFCRLRLVLAVATGRLGRSPVFRTWRTTSLHVRSRNGPLRLARDGETFDGATAFDIVKGGDRLAVYAPRPTRPTSR